MDQLVQQLTDVCRVFKIDYPFHSYDVITIGNINTTYKVTFQKEDGEQKSFILQRINNYVFKHPEEIMENIDLVTTYIRENTAERDDRVALHYHHTLTQANYYYDGGDNFWRLCNYVDSVTYNSCQDLNVLRATGAAFGEFQSSLSGFDASRLYETIPNFHNTKKRLEGFFVRVEEDEYGRVGEVQAEIDYIRSQRELASQLSNMLERGELPLRVTHNYTKINNVLFDRVNNQPLTVIDLDTVMPGLAMYDFGDAVRFAANTAEEDEKDLSKVSLDLDRFRAFAEGFIPPIASCLTPLEIDTMALGALTIAIELGLRFLEDYITGDKYFRTRYPGHNLVRARCQLELARDMQRKMDQMNAIVHEIAEKAR